MDVVGEESSVPPDVVIDSDPRSGLNISDVFEAISIADPSFGAGAGVEDAMPRLASAVAPQSSPCVRIVEQPASKALRFRYECEGRSAGSIPGVNSTNDKKTYPTIEICGYTGPAVVVVSCVTKEEPYKPHPHNLVGRERCSRGVCTVKTEFTEENSLVTFSNLGIQCVKRKDIAAALEVREGLRVDPFRTGYAHKNQAQSIDLNAVRLCFQVFLPDKQTGRIQQYLRPVVSDVIYDKKAMCDLLIMRVSQCSGSSKGGTEMILLCEKVTREDTAVVFFQQEKEKVVWEATANIILVHKQVAIAFTTPAYRNPRPPDLVEVYVQLKRISDNARSNAVPFTYIPDYADSDYLSIKRRKTPLLQSEYKQESKLDFDPIKSEPRDRTSPHTAARSPPLRGYDPQYRDHDPYAQQWQMQGNMNVAGPSQPSFNQDMPWSSPPYQMLQNVQALSPLQPVMSPLQALAPGLAPLQSISPGMQASPGHVSPGYMHGAVSPMGHSPMGHISPNLVQQQNIPQMPQMMDTSAASEPPSLTNLLAGSEGMQQLTSGDLSGLTSLLCDRAPDLSDSLTRLTTSDFLHHADLQ